MKQPTQDFSGWYETILANNPGDSLLTPGLASRYMKLSRTAIYKAVKEGRITGFTWTGPNSHKIILLLHRELQAWHNRRLQWSKNKEIPFSPTK